jgi:segregation and condensation protein B
MTTTTTTPEADEATDSDNVVAFRPRAAAPADQAGSHTGAQSHTHAPAPAGNGMPLEQTLEALLFVSPTPLTVGALAEATEQDEEVVEECLLDMLQRWSDASSGIVLERVAGGWAFRASDHARDALARLLKPQADTRISPSALETLAVVAYLQPVSRPDVARIRGVSVDAAMSNLLERGFVEEAGRSESGAVQFRTTPLFERAFGLSSVGSLPELEGFAPDAEGVERLRSQLESMASARVD